MYIGLSVDLDYLESHDVSQTCWEFAFARDRTTRDCTTLFDDLQLSKISTISSLKTPLINADHLDARDGRVNSPNPTYDLGDHEESIYRQAGRQAARI